MNGPELTAARDGDVAMVAKQLGREPHAISEVAVRCPWGMPAVVECLPANAAGEPFPTLYYCTCPTLVAAVGVCESAGGVRLWEERLAASPRLARSLAAGVAETRRRRAELARRRGLTLLDGGAALESGIGGVADPRRVKCLHAHVAQALARPAYRFGTAILAELQGPWCADARCGGEVPANDAGPSAG